MKNYQKLARAIVARNNCLKSNNEVWEEKWENEIDEIIKIEFPSGSGFDNGTKFDLDDNAKFNGDKLVFTTAFHHMNEGGYYDGWTEHTVTVKPSLAMEFTITISGRDRNDIKEHIRDCFHTALDAETITSLDKPISEPVSS